VGSPTNGTNPFLSSPPAQAGNIVDLFGAADPAVAAVPQQQNALDDLLQLGNPFSDMFAAQAQPQVQQQQQWMNGKIIFFKIFQIFRLNFNERDFLFLLLFLIYDFMKYIRF
jgi:hypothetical protein